MKTVPDPATIARMASPSTESNCTVCGEPDSVTQVVQFAGGGGTVVLVGDVHAATTPAAKTAANVGHRRKLKRCMTKFWRRFAAYERSPSCIYRYKATACNV